MTYDYSSLSSLRFEGQKPCLCLSRPVLPSVSPKHSQLPFLSSSTPLFFFFLVSFLLSITEERSFFKYFRGPLCQRFFLLLPSSPKHNGKQMFPLEFISFFPDHLLRTPQCGFHSHFSTDAFLRTTDLFSEPQDISALFQIDSSLLPLHPFISYVLSLRRYLLGSVAHTIPGTKNATVNKITESLPWSTSYNALQGRGSC